MSWAAFAASFGKYSEARLGHADMYDLALVASQVLTGVTNDGTRIHAHCPFCHKLGSSWKSLLVNLTDAYGGYGFVACQNVSCAWRGGWNQLAEARGFDPLVPDENPPSRIVAVCEEQYEYRGFYEFPLTKWGSREWNRDFIDGCGTVISPYAFNMLDAKYGVDWQGNEWAVLPGYTQHGKPYGHVKLLLSERKPGLPKSVNSRGSWVGSCVLGALQMRRGMTNSTSLVLTEGPPDALRLIDNGIAAVPSLGCGTWTSTKSDILHSLGFKRVYVCMNTDANEAGQRGGDKAQRLLEEAGLEVVRVWQPLGVDLCRMPVHELHAYLNTNFH